MEILDLGTQSRARGVRIEHGNGRTACDEHPCWLFLHVLLAMMLDNTRGSSELYSLMPRNTAMVVALNLTASERAHVKMRSV